MCSVTKPSAEYNELIEEYKKLHIDPTIFPGKSITKYTHYIRSIIQDNKCKTLLDYGCGKGELYEDGTKGKLDEPLHKFWKIKDYTLYDPGLEKFSKLPTDTYDMVICVDVMEHLPTQDLEWIIDRIMSFANKAVFLNIACYEALKKFPNGKNVHISVHEPEWWIDLINKIWYDKHQERINTYIAFEEVENRFISTGIFKTHVNYRKHLSMREKFEDATGIP